MNPPWQSARPKPPARGLAWLALLLVIVVGLSGAWVAREGYHREQALAKRLSTLDSTVGREQSDLQQMEARARDEWRSALEKLASATRAETDALTRRIEAREAAVSQLQDELGRFSVSDRNSWLLSETDHLLRLANQRLVMARDPAASLALLQGADDVLQEIDDPTLHTVRAAIAADMAALRAVPKIDVEGLYLRLSALVEQAGQLVIFDMPRQPDRAKPAPAEEWRGRLRQGYEAALARLSEYLLIRRRDVPVQALMDPQWEGLVRQNLRMLLEQAQVALLSGNQALYTASLERAQHWVGQFLQSDEAAATALSAELTRMAGANCGADTARSLPFPAGHGSGNEPARAVSGRAIADAPIIRFYTARFAVGRGPGGCNRNRSRLCPAGLRQLHV